MESAPDEKNHGRASVYMNRKLECTNKDPDTKVIYGDPFIQN